MSSERGSESRNLDMEVSILVLHLRTRLGLLPRFARRYHLSQETVDSLRVHLQEELDYLKNLPSDMTFKEVIDLHHERTDQFSAMIPQRKQSGVYGANNSSGEPK